MYECIRYAVCVLWCVYSSPSNEIETENKFVHLILITQFSLRRSLLSLTQFETSFHFTSSAAKKKPPAPRAKKHHFEANPILKCTEIPLIKLKMMASIKWCICDATTSDSSSLIFLEKYRNIFSLRCEPKLLHRWQHWHSICEKRTVDHTQN